MGFVFLPTETESGTTAFSSNGDSKVLEKQVVKNNTVSESKIIAQRRHISEYISCNKQSIFRATCMLHAAFRMLLNDLIF